MPGPRRRSRAVCLEAALGYVARVWSVVPAAERGMQPIIPWETYQDGQPCWPEAVGLWVTVVVVAVA